MKPFLRGRVYYVKLRTEDGEWVQLSTGTRDRKVAEAYSAMLDRLGARGEQAWDLIHAVCAKPQRLSLASLFSAYRTNQLRSLRDRLNDEDLEPWVERFLIARRGQIQPDTEQHYRIHLAHFIPAGRPFLRSHFTTSLVRSKLDELQRSSATKRKYRAALMAFVAFLQQHEVLLHNPAAIARVAGRVVARDSYLDRATLLKVLMAMPEPWRSVAAILHATGADVSQLLSVRVRDVEIASRQLQLRHGKTSHRNRSVLVLDWAWPYVTGALDRSRSIQDGPDALLFPGVNRWTVSDHFRAACRALGVSNYTLRDARHSYAVEVLKAGGSPQAVARQLGHANTALVHRVYGRYMPADAEVVEAHRRVARASTGSLARRRGA